MTDENEQFGSDSGSNPFPSRVDNPFAWAWGRSFLAGAILISIVYESLVVWLASDKWRIVLMPLSIIPIYGLAHWINARRRRAKNM